MNEGMLGAVDGKGSDEWETPDWFFKALDTEFGFTLDPAATDANHKTPVYFTKTDDGLSMPWFEHRVFVNPPYSEIEPWVRKARDAGTLVVMLLPSRTDTSWFQMLLDRRVEIRWLRKRIAFEVDGKPAGAPRFGSLLAIWR